MKKLLMLIAALSLIAFSGSYATSQERALQNQCWWIANDGSNPWQWMPKANPLDPQWTRLKSIALDAYVWGNKDALWNEILSGNGCIYSFLNTRSTPKVVEFRDWLTSVISSRNLIEFNNNFNAKLGAASEEYPTIMKDICQCMHDRIKARLG